MSEPVAVQPAAHRDDKLLAALSHALIVVPWIGTVGAVVVYAVNRERNRWLAFQAVQAAAYQLLVTLATIVAWGCWTVFYLLSLVPLMANPDAYAQPPWFFWVGLVSMVVPFALMGLLALYGLYGALRTMQGRPFRYVVLGNWIARSIDGDADRG
jgi:uncharacterized Tic20 family protein